MGTANQEPESFTILILSHDSASFANIANNLSHSDITLVQASSLLTAQSALETSHPDILFVADVSRENVQWLVNCKHLISTQTVTVLLTDEMPVEVSELDLILLPNSLTQLEFWLWPFLKLRGRLKRLESHNHQLQGENISLKQDLSSKHHSPIDINLLKNSIVHSVSHELRTPMLQVKSAVALLAEDAGPNRRIVELALEATTRLEAGVRNVTLLNELMNESLETQSFVPAEAGQLIRSAIRNLQRSWEHKDDVERIRVNIPEFVAPVLGDRQRLVIAIQLLLDNALKFSQAEVDVAAAVFNHELNISISDKGIGIPTEHLSHIFEPFYQVDGSSTRRFGGMGIGLAIVRFILDYHQTQIRVTSTPGKGSTFSFTLPFAPDQFNLRRRRSSS